MTLVPNAALREPDVYERSGLFLIKHAGSIVVSTRVPERRRRTRAL